nr:MAG TPA_asm: hypothetical protein [Caudoviricetes sp.]DAL49138.1 MAG TPA_asm: hypothetical protein [Caudoviricetes sp.]
MIASCTLIHTQTPLLVSRSHFGPAYGAFFPSE